jgi:hypothetical protein
MMVEFCGNSLQTSTPSLEYLLVWLATIGQQRFKALKQMEQQFQLDLLELRWKKKRLLRLVQLLNSWEKLLITRSSCPQASMSWNSLSQGLKIISLHVLHSKLMPMPVLITLNTETITPTSRDAQAKPLSMGLPVPAMTQ